MQTDEEIKKVAKKIFDDLSWDISDRKGLKNNWGYNLDEDIQKEIEEKWIKIISNGLSSHSQKLKEKIEGKKLDTTPYGFDFSNCSDERRGYNKALEDVINIINNS